MPNADTEFTIPLSVWAQAILHLDGEPFSLAGREYLIPIYNNRYSRILLKAGRQVSKSTTIAAFIISLCTGIPYFKCVYGASAEYQVRSFSHQKLTPFINFSPAVMRQFMSGRDCLNNVMEKRFSNGSTIMLRVSQDEDVSIRSLSGDLLALDEIQDMTADAITIAEQVLFASENPLYVCAGTPKSLSNPIETMWRNSSQTEWLIPCRSCSGIISGPIITSEVKYWNNIGLRNVAPFGLICAMCGRKIHVEDGVWVDMNAGARTKGFRLSQPMCTNDFDTLYYDKIKNPQYSIAKIMNEVFGVSFDSATDFISQSSLIEICSPSKGGGHPMAIAPDKKMRQYPAFAGIDWGVGVEGGSDTVLHIGYSDIPSRVKVIYARKFDHTIPSLETTQLIIDALKTFNVGLIASDWGAAGDRNAILASVFGPEKIIQIQSINSVTFVEKIRGDIDMLRIGRTLALSDWRTDFLERNAMCMPMWEMYKEFAPGILAEYIDEDSLGNMRYDHKDSQHDDVLWSLVYLNLARKIHYGIPIIKLVVNTEKEE